MYAKGLTLLELLIALALGALLVSLAFWPMQKLINVHQAELIQQQIINTLNFARNSAATLQKTVALCPSQDQENCGTDWHQPWLIFVIDKSTDTPKVLHIINIKNSQDLTVQFANQNKLFSFSANGTANSGTFQYCSKDISWEITVNNSGRILTQELSSC